MFSIHSAMCDGKYVDRSEREVNLGGREGG